MSCRKTFFVKFVGHVLHDMIECCANRRIQSEAISRGDSFDQSAANLGLYLGWRKRREEPTNVSAIVWNRSESPQRCRAQRCWQSEVRKDFLNGTDAVSITAPPPCSIENTSNQVNLFTNHNGTDCENEFFFFFKSPFFLKKNAKT